MVHEDMVRESYMADNRFNYYRPDVEEGLSALELNEWQTRRVLG